LRVAQKVGNLQVVENEECQGMGLRERKKLATREALCDAAVRLALVHGAENVRVPDIAAEAGVSPRTFNNYFSSVPEAICAMVAEQMLRLPVLFRERPVTEPLAEAITSAIVEVHASHVYEKEIIRLIITSPLLRGEFFKTIVARENALADAIAERVGSPPGDLFPHILASSYFSATRVVTHRWLHDDDVDFLAVLRTAIDLIAPMAAKADPAPADLAQADPARANAAKPEASEPKAKPSQAA
jgi:AcrR family transcriptional regulator